jgi:hypothetical protein
MNPRPETIISFCCRLKLAKDLEVEPADLRYNGKMYGPDYDLHLFTVTKFAHPLYGSTKSVKVDA